MACGKRADGQRSGAFVNWPKYAKHTKAAGAGEYDLTKAFSL